MFLLKKQKSVHKQEVQGKKCDNKFMNEIWECGFVFLLKKKKISRGLLMFIL